MLLFEYRMIKNGLKMEKGIPIDRSFRSRKRR